MPMEYIRPHMARHVTTHSMPDVTAGRSHGKIDPVLRRYWLMGQLHLQGKLQCLHQLPQNDAEGTPLCEVKDMICNLM